MYVKTFVMNRLEKVFFYLQHFSVCDENSDDDQRTQKNYFKKASLVKRLRGKISR